MEENLIQIIDGIMINVDENAKASYMRETIQNPATCTCKNGKYLANVIDNSVIMFDELIDVEAKQNDEETKTVPTNFNEKDMTCKIQKFCISLAFFQLTYYY